MQLLDNALKIEAEHGTNAAFPQGFAAFVRSHGLPRATAYRHRERVKLEGRWQPRSRLRIPQLGLGLYKTLTTP